MARFRCRACGEEGNFEYRPGPCKCPRCGADDVQVASSFIEMPDDDPFWEQMRAPADDPSDED